MDELTVQEVDTMIEAVDAWVDASKTKSLLAGLMLGGMIGGEMGKQAVDMAMAGEDEKQEQRKNIATYLRPKLLRLRDQIEAREIAHEIK